MKMFEVGGCVRDEILGVPSKDIDFTVVLDGTETYSPTDSVNGIDPFEVMVLNLKEMGFKIFLETPEYLTVRAQFPDKYELASNGFQHVRQPRLTADFVLARKESGYTDGRRPDVVLPGTLEDDLARRDFTMNAIAKEIHSSGESLSIRYIDPFNGREDIANRIIRAVGDPFERLTEDALRAVRAVRFAVTKGFRIDPALEDVMESDVVLDSIIYKISDERIKDELSKMFRFDTVKSLNALGRRFPLLTEAMFSGSVSLDATMKTKGRGK